MAFVRVTAAAALLFAMAACTSPSSEERAEPSEIPSAPTSSAGVIPGCAPQCLEGSSDPGTLSAGAYTTEHFLAGQLTVIFEDAWESHEDQPVEFSAAPAGKWDVHRVLFWSDLLPVGPDGNVVDGVPNTAAGLHGWLRKRPNLRVSTPKRSTVGRAKLPATVMDIGIAPDADNEDPGCPAKACVAPFTWPGAGDNKFGLARPEVLRLYLCDVSYGGSRHLLAVAVEGDDRADLRTFAPIAERVIASADAPLTAG